MNITVIGGGTGSTVVLEGLKEYRDLNISIIVGMTDDGGSNATVRDEFGLLPLSDVRKSIIALSEKGNNEIIRKLFTYRFSNGENIKGHTVGNLLMVAMTDIMDGEIGAIEMFKMMFNVRGNVIPVTLDSARLVAHYSDGSKIESEHLIDEIKEDKKIVDFQLDSKAKAYPQAINSIKEAEYIILGPGDLFTTLLCNLLVEGIPQAIKESKAKIIYITNLMTKVGQTRHRTHKQIIEMIEKHCGRRIDYILMNNEKLPEDAFKRYIADGENFIIDDLKDDEQRKIIRTALVASGVVKREKGDELVRSLIRHDSDKLAKELYKIFYDSSLKRFFKKILAQYVD